MSTEEVIRSALKDIFAVEALKSNDVYVAMDTDRRVYIYKGKPIFNMGTWLGSLTCKLISSVTHKFDAHVTPKNSLLKLEKDMDPLKAHFENLNFVQNNKNVSVKNIPHNDSSIMFSTEFKDYLPESGLPTYLPDFVWTKHEDNQYTKEQLASVPKKEKLYLPVETVWTLAYAVENDNYSMLVGPPGVAKTAFVKQLAHHRNQPFIRIQGVEDMDTATMIGAETFKNNEVTYKYGVIANAVKDGYLLLLDEKNRMPGAIAFALQQLLERGGDLLLPNSEGSNEDRVVKRHKNFRVLAADNSLGFGDKHGIIYQQQDISSLDRAENVFSFDYMDSNMEIKLWVEEYKLNKPLVESLVLFANQTRSAYSNGDLLLGLTTRSMRPLLEKLALYNEVSKEVILMHLTHTYFNKIPDEQLPTIQHFFDSTFSDSQLFQDA